MIPCMQCPLRKLPLFSSASPEEIQFIQEFKVAELTVDSGKAVYLEGDPIDQLYTILSGWAFRYKSMPDGRRQIVGYSLQGDFVGLQNTLSQIALHGVEALTQLRLCVFPQSKLPLLFQKQPSLALDLTWLSAREEIFLDENLLSVGRRTAEERVAYLLWHLHTRAVESGLTSDNTIILPMTQQHLADTLGISLVYVNKTLQRLRATGCVTLNGRNLIINDKVMLARLAGADPARPERRPLI